MMDHGGVADHALQTALAVSAVRHSYFGVHLFYVDTSCDSGVDGKRCTEASAYLGGITKLADGRVRPLAK